MLAWEQNHLFLTRSDNTIPLLVFTIDDGNMVKLIVPNLDFGRVLPAWEVQGMRLISNNCFRWRQLKTNKRVGSI
jgi:hypothetical protein